MKNRKLISALLAVATVMSSFCSVFAAEEKKITVTVNDRLIHFADQEPVISENDNTLIPVRGVFEAMDAKVTWNAKERSVYVQAKNNIDRIKLFIDNPIAKKYTLTSITAMDSEDIELSTPPTIMNDRTMIPLRVVGESIGATVDWDPDTRHITIISKEYKELIADNTATEDDGSVDSSVLKTALPYLYIEADKTQAKVGEDITIELKLGNSDKLYENSAYAGITATLFYDKAKLTAGGLATIVKGEKVSQTLSASNPDFYDGSYKYVSIIMPNTDVANEIASDGVIASFSFTVTDNAPTEISLSNRTTHLGEDTALMINKGNEDIFVNLAKPAEIYIDTTPIVINAQ